MSQAPIWFERKFESRFPRNGFRICVHVCAALRPGLKRCSVAVLTQSWPGKLNQSGRLRKTPVTCLTWNLCGWRERAITWRPATPAMRSRGAVFFKETGVSVYETLESLKIELPALTKPVAAFVPFTRVGALVFVSGHIAKRNGKPWEGQLGANLTIEQGREAARGVAIELIATLNAAVGDLNLIRRIVKMQVLVNSTPAFTDQHLVANGASELLVAVFGDGGAHARAAFGVAQIPFGSCVEIDLIAEVDDK